MKTTILTVGSITQAVKARKLLARNGIRAKLVKINSEKAGCNYAIEIRAQSQYDVASILRSEGISYSLRNGE